MAKRKIYERFIDLPQGVQDFFLEKADEVYSNMIEKYKLENETFFDEIEEPVLKTTLGFATLQESLQRVQMNLNKAKASIDDQREIIRIILRDVLWPIRDIFNGELKSFLKEIGVDPGKWPQERVLLKPISYSGATSEVLQRLQMHTVGKNVRTSLREMIEKFAKGQYVPSQMKEAMVRLPDFGGMGLDAETADKAIEIIVELSKNVAFVSEEEYSDLISAKAMSADEGRKALAEQKEDEEEIKTLRASTPAKPAVVTELDKAVEAAWDRIEKKPSDEYLQKRLRNVISSRLRDVRNASELSQLLQRDIKVGGMGIAREEADIAAREIEAVYKDYRQKIEQEEKMKLDKQLVEQKRKIEERRKQEAEEHARWYQEKIKARQEEEGEKEKLAAALKAGLKQMPKHPVDVKSEAVLTKKYGKMIPAPPPKAAAKPAFGISGRAAPPQAKVKISEASARLAAEGPLKVDGIAAAPKLSGLVGELGNMSLSQFRRLGKTPAESTAKILERMSTLNEESFNQKLSGIKAWQASPVMKEYLSLVSESFKTQKPILAIAELKRKEGKDTLTQEEIQVLVELNNQLHY
ncbi:MAG: hypothetical protein ACOYUZ_01050 [Patescibacteria group bacterium]